MIHINNVVIIMRVATLCFLNTLSIMILLISMEFRYDTSCIKNEPKFAGIIFRSTILIVLN